MRKDYDAFRISHLDIWLDVGSHVGVKMMAYAVSYWLDLRCL